MHSRVYEFPIYARTDRSITHISCVLFVSVCLCVKRDETQSYDVCERVCLYGGGFGG